MSFPVLEEIMITVCDCSLAPIILLRAGLFPCTPQLPTLAVDVELLEFVTELFLNLPPNNRALCETLEVFLAARRYKLATRDSLRVRFRNAVQWYSTLLHNTKLQVDGRLHKALARLRHSRDDSIWQPRTAAGLRLRPPPPSSRPLPL
ncbi:hypothetical protein GGX14DRAFT_352247 [Mycena pura]|uniref:Uncharacterized protein n=1 Tax=Mycena pura TaxID=153505 RepID=A0AAD6YLB7_9AGAR|nr:hypothetical protein GGX14DRAFT_352247 [Mycena pura]